MSQHTEPIYFLQGELDSAFELFLALNQDLTKPPVDGDFDAHIQRAMRRAFHAGLIAQMIERVEKASPLERPDPDCCGRCDGHNDECDSEERKARRLATQQIDQALSKTQD
jgi:hypothetical protein